MTKKSWTPTDDSVATELSLRESVRSIGQMQMNKKELEAFAKGAAKGIKTPEDLNEFSQMLKKITVEAALNAEMDEHLGYFEKMDDADSELASGNESFYYRVRGSPRKAY